MIRTLTFISFLGCRKHNLACFCSETEVTEKLGISGRPLNQCINENRLLAKKIGRSYVVRESDLELVRERKVGRPLKDDKS